MSSTNLTCKEVMNYLCQSIGEDIDSEKCIAFKKHLENCIPCNNYFESIKTTINLYKSYNVELPAEAHNELMKILNLHNC